MYNRYSVKMKCLSVLFFVLLVNFVVSYEDCPFGEYNPGPNCGLEPSCASRSPHSYPKTTCDCWCVPGTYRIIETNKCVTLSGCND